MKFSYFYINLSPKSFSVSNWNDKIAKYDLKFFSVSQICCLFTSFLAVKLTARKVYEAKATLPYVERTTIASVTNLYIPHHDLKKYFYNMVFQESLVV